ncbi:hypothetical protein HETIRDRAFT_460016 [Heterobasidion irregulare TC 32-1]|uniref:Symplekin n=1 Tax=Heterobasidion irregulare (strain TC 32-1) TaxID=747525 RepID=W4K0X9_HETIT|nr:uncharacterized protein HETIRDRAFT_460016 [Heterobasidion irregulare TC 32-1]ETW78990.1 hypothetical protein HETIRDRAFT_460016 [Heterobasidion irregulare TC 32-1]
MATHSGDPLQVLQAALHAQTDSQEQADLLATVRQFLEANPSTIPIFCSTIIQRVIGAPDTLLKRWLLDLLHFGMIRSSLSLEARTQLASQFLEVLAGLLHDPSPHIVKTIVQMFGTIYPLLFRFFCTNRNNRHHWDILTHSKTRILEFVWASGVHAGVRLAAVKFMQRVILVQTRGIADPRVLQNKNDPNLSMCPTDHPFIPVAQLEAEASRLIEAVITTLFTNPNVDLLSAILNSWSNLIKLRPNLVQLVVSTLASWTPAALAGQSYNSIKSVEKAVRILLNHILRGPQGAPFQAQINEALSVQASRMERAAAEEKARKAALKRPPSVSTDENKADPKRQKVDHTTPHAASILSAFDFTSLPAALITELVVANLQAFSEDAFTAIMQAYKASSPLAPAPTPAVMPAATPVAGPSTLPSAATDSEHASNKPEAAVIDEGKEDRTLSIVKDEPVDPLQMDIDQDELEYEPDKLNLELAPMQEDEELAAVTTLDAKDIILTNIKIPPPLTLAEPEREALVKRGGGQELWMLLIIRMVTRVVDPDPDVQMQDDTAEEDSEEVKDAKMVTLYERQDKLRRTLCDYIMTDFSGRIRLATTWMNEEWYNDQIQTSKNRDWRPNYDTWLNQIVSVYQNQLDGKDRAFGRFLLDLPHVPPDVFTLLRDLCVEPDRMQVGFTTLRDFVTQRPTMRAEALNVLLELTTHPEKVTRGAAIITVKRWVGDAQPMDGMIREFALQLLRRLQSKPKAEKPHGEDVQMNEHEDNIEDGQLPPDDILQTPYLPEQLELPAQKAQVLQHLELLFALSVKVSDFLEETFAAYGEMDVTVQEAVQDLITALIRSLGPTHGKLLTLMRTFPPGADTLALRVLSIFTEHGRPSAQLVALVKALIAERDLDARFLIPIIAEMDKADIVKHLPKIVSILNGTPEPKNLVRSVFGAIVTTPPQTFGSVTSNLPRVRQSELLTPAELMVLLHDFEKEIGLKSAIEAIGICFSMTDVFRSEILAVVMQQIVDEPVLPTLFLRTVIQAVTTYKSLVGFVSTTLLSRLITKKIWMNPPLWEGFIRCAKVIAPASFGALLQLPKEQLRELVDKQPSLKAGLREYVMKKAGNKARVAGYLDIFGEDDSTPTIAATPPTPTPPLATPTSSPAPIPASPAVS